jgi:hypothetical protein
VSEIESSTPASTSARGPVGETRSVGLSILWFILTIGIYGIYWVYKTQEEVKRYSGNGVGGVLGIVIYILISPVTFFIVPSEVRYMYEDLDGGQSPVRGVTGLWFLPCPARRCSSPSCSSSRSSSASRSSARTRSTSISRRCSAPRSGSSS